MTVGIYALYWEEQDLIYIGLVLLGHRKSYKGWKLKN